MADESSKPPSDDKAADAGTAGRFSTIGFEFLAAVLIPGALGYWLDGKWHTAPWLMIGGGGFGFCVGLYRMLKAANEVMR